MEEGRKGEKERRREGEKEGREVGYLYRLGDCQGILRQEIFADK